MLQNMSGFGEVLYGPASEVEATSINKVPFNFVELVQSTPMITRPPTFYFASEVKNTYFQHENGGNGASYLVLNCCFQSKKEVGNNLENDHRYHLDMAHHMNTLSRQQKDLFVNLIDYTVVMTEDLAEYSHINDDVPSHVTTPPRTMQDLRHCYLIGEYATLPNVTMAPHCDISGHATIYVCDCIKDMFGHGVSI
jgi:hypothetical protein